MLQLGVKKSWDFEFWFLWVFRCFWPSGWVFQIYVEFWEG